MSAKLPSSPTVWVDPDDAPELTDEFFEKATFMVGEKAATLEEYKTAVRPLLARGRPLAETPKKLLSVRFDSEVIEGFKRMGKGWQTQMNQVLKEYLANIPTGK